MGKKRRYSLTKTNILKLLAVGTVIIGLYLNKYLLGNINLSIGRILIPIFWLLGNITIIILMYSQKKNVKLLPKLLIFMNLSISILVYPMLILSNYFINIHSWRIQFTVAAISIIFTILAYIYFLYIKRKDKHLRSLIAIFANIFLLSLLFLLEYILIMDLYNGEKIQQNQYSVVYRIRRSARINPWYLKYSDDNGTQKYLQLTLKQYNMLRQLENMDEYGREFKTEYTYNVTYLKDSALILKIERIGY